MKNSELQVLIEPVVTALDLVIWGVECLPRPKGFLVRVYIDGAGGVSVDDCARVSRQVNSLLHVEGGDLGEYTLEVSSPGIERRLFNLDQYRHYIGESITVRLRSVFEGRRRFSGQLVSVEGDDVVVSVDEDEYLLPFHWIDRAVIILQPDRF